MPVRSCSQPVPVGLAGYFLRYSCRTPASLRAPSLDWFGFRVTVQVKPQGSRRYVTALSESFRCLGWSLVSVQSGTRLVADCSLTNNSSPCSLVRPQSGWLVAVFMQRYRLLRVVHFSCPPVCLVIGWP